jgi:hypothetical protein
MTTKDGATLLSVISFLVILYKLSFYFLEGLMSPFKLRASFQTHNARL